MRTAPRVLLSLALGAVVLLGVGGSSDHRASPVAEARAAQDWRKEFDDICSKTQDAMALSADELRSLVARCESLKQQLDKLDESSRKVFTKRLQACRDLYQFVLESREKP
jgi:hypothetical protein